MAVGTSILRPLSSVTFLQSVHRRRGPGPVRRKTGSLDVLRTGTKWRIDELFILLPFLAGLEVREPCLDSQAQQCWHARNHALLQRIKSILHRVALAFTSDIAVF